MNLKEFHGRMIIKYDLEDLYLYESRGNIVLSNVRVKKENRKKGVGTAFMNELIAFADEHNMKILLTPATSDYEGTTSASRLKKFYKRFGFVENKGRNKDYRIGHLMFRRPNESVKESVGVSFKDLRESFDTTYQWEVLDENIYRFYTEGGDSVLVQFSKINKQFKSYSEHDMEISFIVNGNANPRAVKAGNVTHAKMNYMRLFSTVSDVMRHYDKTHPEVTSYLYFPVSTGLASIYMRIIKKSIPRDWEFKQIGPRMYIIMKPNYVGSKR